MRATHQDLYLRAFSDYLRKKGKNLTQERISIFKTVLSKKSHFEADSIIYELRMGEDRVSRATVYRTMKIMEEMGMIQAMHDLHQHTHYEPKFLRRHHDHLICEECGKVIEFRNDEIENLQEVICEQKKFYPSHHIMQIYGLCHECHGANHNKRRL